MRLDDVVRISFSTATDKKLRFLLNLVGILIGCAAVGGLISVTDGMRQDISDQIMGFGPNVINVYSSNEGYRTPVQLDWRDMRIIESIDGVENVTPMNFGGTCAYKVQGQFYYTSVTGVSEQYFLISGAWELLEGRYFTRNDKGVAVVTKALVQPFGVDEPLYEIGDRLTVTYMRGGEEHQYTFRIVGIITDSASGIGSQSSASMYIPMSSFEQMYETEGVIHLIKLCTFEINQVPEVAEAIEETLGYVNVWTMDMSMENLNSVLNTMNAVLGGIAGLSLIVAGVGIINTMTVSIMERTKEIGTMKALGAKSMDIMKMVMSEAILTGVVGGIIGALVGFGLSYIISHFTEVPSATSPTLGVLIVGFAMITCVLSGLHPAWRASNMNPVEALRHE
ncbi:MAG: ABC transporter permease [Candidatus Bathyarchaeota archaeon]|nr:ABC transporter permease [Candidatus Bathyarchaeota archaeon]